MNYPYSYIFRISLFASPLLGLSVYLPVYFLANIPDEEMFQRVPMIIGTIFLLWQINLLTLWLTKRYDNAYLRFAVSFSFTLSVIILINLFMDSPPKKFADTNVFFPKGLFLVGGAFNLIILFIIELILANVRKKMIQDENNRLRIRNLEAQQQQLKQQIQPHFLFNSLNTLKSLISSYPAEAEEYLVKLSSLLRYNLKAHTSDVILLHEELKICSDYLEMQKVRFGKALQYSMVIDRDEYTGDTYLPIFAIQLLIENAIKHNVLTLDTPLKIEITIGIEAISVSNNLQEKVHESGSTQIGLKNLSERYRLLKQKDIEINKSGNAFRVVLPL